MAKEKLAFLVLVALLVIVSLFFVVRLAVKPEILADPTRTPSWRPTLLPTIAPPEALPQPDSGHALVNIPFDI